MLLPLSRLLFPGLGNELDGHHAFVIRYAFPRGDVDLAPHRDDAEVTFNVALGRRWRGCDLIFCGLMQDRDVHQHRLSHRFPGEAGSGRLVTEPCRLVGGMWTVVGAGWAVLHLGRQVHERV